MQDQNDLSRILCGEKGERDKKRLILSDSTLPTARQILLSRCHLWSPTPKTIREFRECKVKYRKPHENDKMPRDHDQSFPAHPIALDPGIKHGFVLGKDQSDRHLERVCRRYHLRVCRFGDHSRSICTTQTTQVNRAKLFCSTSSVSIASTYRKSTKRRNLRFVCSTGLSFRFKLSHRLGVDPQGHKEELFDEESENT